MHFVAGHLLTFFVISKSDIDALFISQHGGQAFINCSFECSCFFLVVLLINHINFRKEGNMRFLKTFSFSSNIMLLWTVKTLTMVL